MGKMNVSVIKDERSGQIYIDHEEPMIRNFETVIFNSIEKQRAHKLYPNAIALVHDENEAH